MLRAHPCRFCRKSAHPARLVKYSVRHYAHFDCYLDAGKSLKELPVFQVGRFPFSLLVERGLAAEAAEISKAHNERWAMTQRVIRGEPQEGDYSHDGLRIYDGKKWVGAQQ